MPIDPDPDAKGWICVRLDPSPDASWALSGEGWQKSFDVLEVSAKTFERLDEQGFWSGLNRRANLLIDWREEEWLEPDSLDAAADYVAEFSRAHPDAPVAEDLLRLIHSAKAKGLPVIFAF